MATAYLYVLGASSDPDRVECGVPWRIDDREIFFGPCKMKLRERLRPRLLAPDRDKVVLAEDIYFAGFNALPTPHQRKLVWAGRMTEAMSFARAWRDLRDPRYAAMRGARSSPLHVEPVAGSEGRPTAYRHHGLEHAEDQKWVRDIATDSIRRVLAVEDGLVRLPPGVSWWHGFARDICFRFENVFFANGAGREIDRGLLDILREAQPDRRGISPVAIFGLTKAGQPDGRVGGYLELTGALGDRFVAWLREPAGRLPQADDELPRVRTTGGSRRGRC